MPLKFDSLDLSPALLTVVAELGYTELTPIQAQSIPVLLEGRDLVGQSETGSGKTAAFGLPVLHRLQLAPRALQTLVLCPTRELAAQVATELRRLGRRHPGLRILEIVGGQPFWPQASSLERRVHVVVGTPGRVLDHLRRGTLDLAGVKTVVLDEADRMLDMGFEEDLAEILRATPAQRQTVLFSATFPPAFEALSAGYQRDAVRVTVETEEAAPETLRQRVLMVEPEAKLDALQWALAEHEHETALVFCNMKATVREVVAALDADGVAADCLHGDLEQFDRDCVMAMFRNRSLRVLVATDVAARGIDITDLALVVNYDLPGQPEVYVHRVGRTGRAGREGASVTLVTPREQRKLAVIEELAGRSIERAEWAPLVDLAVIQRPPAMQTIRVGGGRKDKIRPGDILGALTGDAAGLQGADVGKIEVLPQMTYVAVTADLAQRAARQLDAGRIKGRFFRARLARRGES